jgi:DNA-binding transcriptional LysR family regulator
MDYRYLEAFKEVAKSGSISAAANQLNVAQSAISRQIALLEESMEEDLFFRGARGVKLTPKGEALFKKVLDLDDWISSEFFSESRPVRIGGLEGALNLWLGPRLSKASENTIPPKLFLRQMSNDEIQTALEKNEIDIGLSSFRIESEWISSRKLYSEKISIISKDKIEMNRLDSYCWIGVKKAVYLHRLAKNKEPVRMIQAGSVELLMNLVRAGHGIAAVTESMIPPKGFAVTPTHLSSEAIYLNLPNYERLPQYLDSFIKKFLSER